MRAKIDPSKIRPKAISHFGVQTYDLPKSIDWYCKVLNARVVFQKPPRFAVVTYDEEHHRIAMIQLPGKPHQRLQANPEIQHLAFEMENVHEVLENYARLRDLGIMPDMPIHHGPTLSCYYRDPNGNSIELFADCFPTKQECIDWFFTPVYEHNMGGGVYFDPEELLAKSRAGASVEEIVAYPMDVGMSLDMEDMMKKYNAGVMAEIRRHTQEMARDVATEPAE